MLKNKYFPFLIIIIFSALLFIPNLGVVHLFDWDEINFAEGAREMMVLNDYSRVHINFQPFWEKPPLFMWFQVLSMKAFGVNEFGARFPNAVFGIITLLVLFQIGKKLFDEKLAIIWVSIYAGTLLTQVYFMSGIIDPVFNFFIFCGIYFLAEFSSSGRFAYQPSNSKNTLNIFFSGFFIGLAVLTKGPVAGLLVILSMISYWIIKRKTFSFKLSELVIFFATIGVVSFAWFGLETVKNGIWFLQEFIVYQIRLFRTEDAGHGGPFYYHFLVILIGLFPASLFAIHGFKRQYSDSDTQQNFKLWMVILFWVVMILFSIVKTKIIHYSSLAYFPATFLAAYYLHAILTGKSAWKKWLNFTLPILGVLITSFFLCFPFLMKNKELWIDSVKDKFAAELIKTPVYWSGFESIFIALFLVGIIAGMLLINKGKILQGILILFLFSALAFNLTLKNMLPKIDDHLQKSVIGFYEELQTKDCYVDVLGFKSYANLFYSKKQLPENLNSLNHDWLLNGHIDKPVYFICKSTYAEEALKNHPQLKEVKRENGFVMLVREMGDE